MQSVINETDEKVNQMAATLEGNKASLMKMQHGFNVQNKLCKKDFKKFAAQKRPLNAERKSLRDKILVNSLFDF